jgi:hypothetical protein
MEVMQMHVPLRSLALVLVVSVLAAPTARAQIQPYFGAGFLSPTGDFGEYANAGWAAFVGAQKPIGMSQRSVIGVTVIYGHAPHEGDLNEATNIPGVAVEFGYALTTAARFTPYLRGGVGFIQHRYDPGDTGFDDESETKFAIGVGGGVSTTLGGNTLFGGAHYNIAEDTNFLTIYVGFGLGSAAPPMLRRW